MGRGGRLSLSLPLSPSLSLRESVAQLMDAGKKVVDSPVHLADFGESHESRMSAPPIMSFLLSGAALTSAESWQLQAVLESTVVSPTVLVT